MASTDDLSSSTSVSSSPSSDEGSSNWDELEAQYLKHLHDMDLRNTMEGFCSYPPPAGTPEEAASQRFAASTRYTASDLFKHWVRYYTEKVQRNEAATEAHYELSETPEGCLEIVDKVVQYAQTRPRKPGKKREVGLRETLLRRSVR
ncbi:hypothetical protein MNV49_003054 [Pseudohyphozyma bogoriensis]|nr:hypothetical protein MNV49_003054 [Pseudohyphozyma bogoriensis]